MFSQRFTRSAKDIARWRVKLIFMFNQLEILFDDMLGHTGRR